MTFLLISILQMQNLQTGGFVETKRRVEKIMQS